MNVVLAYGEHGMSVNVPDHTKLVHPEPHSPSSDTYIAIVRSLLEPLGYKRTLYDLGKACETACVVLNAFCPPEVNERLLRPLLKTLHASGLRHSKITILVTAEYPAEITDEILPKILPDDVIQEYRAETHQVFAYTQHELIGKTDAQTPVYIDKRFKKADIKIITDGLFPHFSFGYTGTPVLLTLGLTGPETVQAVYKLLGTHSKEESFLFDLNSRFSQEVQEIVKLSKLDFAVDVSFTRKAQFIDIYAGRPHNVYETLNEELPFRPNGDPLKPADVVISSTGGFLFETSWYHNLLGLCLARRFLKAKSGTIIFATQLFDAFKSKKLTEIQTIEDFVSFFNLDKVIKGTIDYIFPCLKNTRIIFVSPNFQKLSHKHDKTNQLTFQSSMEVALEQLDTPVETSKITALTEGLFSHVILR